MRTSLKYIHDYRDRHGRQRYYFRHGSQSRIALPGVPDSREFREAYDAARAQLRVQKIGENRSVPGSVSAAIGAYYTDHSFLELAPGTRVRRRSILERFRQHFGQAPLAMLERRHIVEILGKQKPFAARNWLTALKGLMAYAVDTGLIAMNPTAGIEPRGKKAGDGIHSWTEAEIALFEAVYAVGTRARLAMALMLYTGQRVSDVERMGPQHIRNGALTIRQKKTGATLQIPIHPELSRIIAASPVNDAVFLTKEDGSPYTNGNMGRWFGELCVRAGLRQCSAHGLRKAACRRLAECGCSAPEIAAISGHRSLKEVQRYIEAADRARLAQRALDRQLEQERNAKVANLPSKSG